MFKEFKHDTFGNFPSIICCKGGSPLLEASQLSGFQLLIATSSWKCWEDQEGSRTPNQTDTFSIQRNTYLYQYGQIPFSSQTNTYSNFNKYIWQFGQIHLAIWTNTAEWFPVADWDFELEVARRLGGILHPKCTD